MSHKDIAEMGELMVEENKVIVDIRKYKGVCGADIILSHKDIAEMGELMVEKNKVIVDIRKYKGWGGGEVGGGGGYNFESQRHS